MDILGVNTSVLFQDQPVISMSASAFEKISDKDLIILLRAADNKVREKAWRHLYVLFLPIINDFVTKNKGTFADSRDVFQECLTVLFDNIEQNSFREESSLQTYLYSICRHIWIRELKKRDNGRMGFREMIEDLKKEDHAVLMDIEIVKVLIKEMRQDCEQILLEYYFNNRSISELKEIFNVNSNQAAKNKKSRCLTYLKQMLKEREIIPYKHENEKRFRQDQGN